MNINPHPNEVWQEVDNRFTRYVKTGKYLKDDRIEITTCDIEGNPIRGKETTSARIDRFSGKYGGYKFIKDIK